ncbi:MAG: arginine--tRNA ligase [Candidatus Cloacimonetes bacterium]|nr:arginine--tRNA ligase [Candidatus Cloacimonadota bacterium]
MLRKKIHNHLLECAEALKIKVNPHFSLEIPNNVNHGDYSTNIAMLSAKLNKKKPRVLADKIAKYLNKNKDYKSVTVAGPGFINFKLTHRIFYEGLQFINKKKKSFGMSNYGEKQKVLIEFVSANPTGPLNIVSARAAAYGDTLSKVLDFVGFNSFKEFYVNDFGNQVDILAESLEIRYRELHGDVVIEFPPEAYHGEYLIDLAVQLNTIEGTKLLHISEKDRLERMKNFALEELHNMQVASLEKFGVIFDNWMSEKKLRKEGAIEETLSYLAEADCTFEKDDAVWFYSSRFGDEKDRVLMKADGNTTYFVPDIAYHITKYQRGFKYLIDVLGPDHHGYVPRLRSALTALKYDNSKLEVVYLQHINLFNEGEIVKMSKRAGKIVTMDELIDDVGKDAARFFFIDRKPSAHLNFDLELARKKSSENPVFYIQYAHARINSVLKKARKAKISLKDYDVKDLSRLSKNSEILIIKKMLEFPTLLETIADSREPHHLATYAFELAGMFHKYYAKYHIINPRFKTMSQSRIYLIKSVKYALANCLHLMGISAPDKMVSLKPEDNEKDSANI